MSRKRTMYFLVQAESYEEADFLTDEFLDAERGQEYDDYRITETRRCFGKQIDKYLLFENEDAYLAKLDSLLKEANDCLASGDRKMAGYRYGIYGKFLSEDFVLTDCSYIYNLTEESYFPPKVTDSDWFIVIAEIHEI